MAHEAQQEFFRRLKAQFAGNFRGVRVIDCGSRDITGSLRPLFEDCEYLGVDLAPGENVDVVSLIHELTFLREFDTVVSGEMLEHDEHWRLSLRKMYEMLKPGGLLAISAAGEGRQEHGTAKTGRAWGSSPDYYRNITKADLCAAFDFDKQFACHEVTEGGGDIYFYGVRKPARILVYHGFVDGGGISPERLRRTAGQFERDLITLKRKGELITLDDALGSQYSIALPLLRKHGMPARFFVPTSLVGQGFHMTWGQLRRISSDCYPIESHTHSHRDFSGMTDAEVLDDLRLSAEIIQQEIGRVPTYVAFPHEEVEERLIRLAREAGLEWIGPRATVVNRMDEKAAVSSPEYWESIYSGQRKAEPGGQECYRVAEVLKHVEGPRVVEAGAGYAPVAKAIKAAHPDWRVVALDICGKAAERSRFKPYHVCSCYEMPFPDKSFNTVVACQLLEYLEDPRAYLKEAKRVGRMLIVTVPKGIHPTCSQLRIYSPESLCALLADFGKTPQFYVTHGMIFGKVVV